MVHGHPGIILLSLSLSTLIFNSSKMTILDWYKLKAFAGKNSHVAKLMKFVPNRLENILRIGEKC